LDTKHINAHPKNTVRLTSSSGATFLARLTMRRPPHRQCTRQRTISLSATGRWRAPVRAAGAQFGEWQYRRYIYDIRQNVGDVVRPVALVRGSSSAQAQTQALLSDCHPFGPVFWRGARMGMISILKYSSLASTRERPSCSATSQSVSHSRYLYHLIPTAAGTILLDTHDAGHRFIPLSWISIFVSCDHILHILIPRSTITFSYCVCRVQSYR
jgi:hypothetical protein